MEQAEESSEQAACSGEQTGASERAETAAEPMDCSEPGQTKEATCSPDDKETIPSDLTAEPVVLSSGSEDQSTQSETPAQDVEMTETWLNHFVEQLGRVPSLWRPGSHRYSGPIKEKTARGFAYVRLITGLEPDYEGDNKSRIQRALALCRRFFSALKKEHRKAALAALEENPLASPDDALRSCPIWVRRADSFLNQMPLVVAQINAQIQEKSHRGSSQREKSKKKKPAGSSLFLKHLGMAPPRLQVPVPPGEEGVKYVRRVVRGIRRAAKVHGGPNKEAIKEVAQRLGATSNRIYQIWWGLCQLALYKLGQVVARGDAATDSGRLDALDWAIADIVLLYTRDMLHDSQYKNYEQLSALLGTFHLVQRFELEKPKQEASPQEWVTAARWYNRNRVQMSALALQKRWFELKQDTRKRFLAQMGVYKSGLPPLPLHQAIARRYAHVVTKRSQPTWRQLVTLGQVAPPTSERGPAPGEDLMVCRNIGDDDSSDSDTARGEDDDVAIVERSLVTIDLSEDNKEEDKNKDAALTSESVGHKTKIKHEGMAVDVTGKASGKPTVNLQKTKTTKNVDKSSKSKKSKQIDKTIDKNKEIVDLDAPELNKIDKSIDKDKEIIDLDAPSPDTDVLEALNKLDVNNVITTISFDSDEDDAKNDKDNDSLKNAKTNEKDLEVPGELASTHEKGNESQKNKAEKRRQRESSDSSSGNLVIDDGIDYESSDSDDPILRRKSSDENTKKIKYNMYDNRRFHEYTPNVYRNRKKRRRKNDKSVTKNIKETDSDVIKEDTNVVEEESSSEDGSRSNDSSEENEEEETSIDPKLLMYAVVVLERICALPTSKPSTETLRSPSPESLPIKTEQPSSPVGPTSPSTQLLLRITPSPPIPSPLLSRLTPSPLDPPPMVSESILSEIPPSCPSLSNLPRFSSNTPPPLAEISPPLSEIPPPLSEIPPPLKPPSPLIFTPEPDSLLHFFASTLPPEFVFNKHNLPLLRECKFCSVPLQRVDAEKGKMGNRVAKKIELPDIEEVRRNNRSMLTAQVAPRRARRRSDSTPSPSSGSDSDWTPGAGRARRAASGDARQPTPDGEGSERPYSDGSSSESEGMPADGFDSDEDLISVVRRRNADGSEFRKLKCRRRVNEADLKRVLDDLAGIEGDKDCTHIKCTSMRGPAAAVLSSNCANCAARVLSAPPISGHEARLQRQLLRRAARMARAAMPTPTTSTATTAVPAIVVATASTTAHTEVTTKASEMKPRSKKSKKRPHSPSRPRAPPSPVDAEAAAREWLRQKNIAAEKFGVKPRSYKKVAPVVQDSAPATIQPITEANNDTAPKPPLKQNEFTILLTNQMGGATVMPLTEANLSKAGLDSTSAFKPSSAAPTLFNPSAVANINKKLGALAPSLDFVPIKPAADKIQTTNANVHIRTVPLMTTTKNNEGFQPLITNVQSLACLPKTPCMVAQARSMPDLNEFTVVNKKDTNNTKSIIIIPAPKSQKKQEGRCKDTENLPQLVNVAGGVSLPSKQGQALHLVVSQSPQKNSVLNQPSTSQQNTVFKNVTKHIYYQPNVSKPNVLNYQPNASTSQTTVLNYQPIASTSQNTGLNYQPNTSVSQNIVLNYQPNTSVSQNTVLNYQPSPSVSQNTVVNYQPNTSVSQNTVLNYQQNTSVSQNTVLNYQSNTKNTVLNFQPSIIVSGSVIQGIEARPKIATSRPYLVTSSQRPPLILNSVLAGQSTQQFRLLNSTQMCAVPQASTVVTASQPSMLFSSMPGHTLNATPMLVRSVHAGPPAPHRPPAAPPHPPTNAARQHPASDEDTADGSEIIMSSRLDWSQPPLSSAAWCRGRDSTTLAVLCTGRVCFIRADRQNYLLVSEEEQPPAEAEYWSLRPRVRLTLPGNEGESEVEPAAKRAKTGSNPAPEPAAAKPSYLKVRAFARLAPDPDKARKFSESPAQGAERPPNETDRPPNEAEKPDKFLAPARVFVNNLIYQKMSDEPLVYAKLLVAVPSTKACRALLTRGKPIQMYCLKTGKLYPLEAEPKNDVSRITLTGDEEISGALLALAKRLYNPYDEVDLEQDSDGSPDKDITEVRNTAGRMINAIENTTKLSSKTRQGHSSRGHSSQGHSSQGHSIQGHSSQSSKEPGKPQDAHAVLLNMLSNKTINTLQSGGPTVTTATKVNTKTNEVIELSDED